MESRAYCGLRQCSPNLGKEKVFTKLVPFCQMHGLSLSSVSTIGRMIGSTPDKLRTSAWQTNSKGLCKRFTRANVTRKPKGVVLKPLECLAFDTIVLHEAITQTFPDYAHAKALTDNASEFKGHFAQRLSSQDVVHCKTYPKTPKMNAHCERFNRTIQECFADNHEDLLFTDLALFNQKMSTWLVFCNTELPHLSPKPNPKKTASLNNLPVSPIEFLLKTHQ